MATKPADAMLPLIDLPEAFNVSTAFLDGNLEQGRGDRVAIYAGDDRITYRALVAHVNRAGNALRSLGVRPEEVRLVTGDTTIVPAGGGTHSDRSMRLAGALLVEASQRIVAQARQVFAALAGCTEKDVSFDGGLFEWPGSNLRLDVFDVARAIASDAALPQEMRMPLSSEARFTGRIPAYPTGAAVCEVEIEEPHADEVLVRLVSSGVCHTDYHAVLGESTEPLPIGDGQK